VWHGSFKQLKSQREEEKVMQNTLGGVHPPSHAKVFEMSMNSGKNILSLYHRHSVTTAAEANKEQKTKIAINLCGMAQVQWIRCKSI